MKYHRRRALHSNDESKNCQAVMIDPFSKATNVPSVPDGKMQLSIGEKFQHRAEVVFGTEDTMICVFYPGLGNGVLWHGIQGEYTGTGSATQWSTCMQPYTSHGTWNLLRYTDNTNTQTAQQAQNPQAQWRVVSQGLKLTLTNNSDQNDGWWECIRTTTNLDAIQWAFAQAVSGPGNGTPIAPNAATMVPRYDNWSTVYQSNFADNPTYQSGRIRDLDKHTFMLKCVNDARTPIDSKGTYNFLDNVLGATGNNTRGEGAQSMPGLQAYDGAFFLGDTANAGLFVNANVDESFDMVIIKLHGRPASSDSSVANTPTRLLSHVCCNQETVYAENTILERLERRSPLSAQVMKNVKNYMDQRLNNGAVKDSDPTQGKYHGDRRRRAAGGRRLTVSVKPPGARTRVMTRRRVIKKKRTVRRKLTRMVKRRRR